MTWATHIHTHPTRQETVRPVAKGEPRWCRVAKHERWDQIDGYGIWETQPMDDARENKQKVTVYDDLTVNGTYMCGAIFYRLFE